MLLVFAWLSPLVSETVSHNPGSIERARALRAYANDLVIHSQTSYHLAPSVVARTGAIAVAALLLAASRVASELAHVRPFYSTRHNLLLLAFLSVVYLLALGVDGAAGGDRAGTAAGVHRGLVDGSGHPGRDGLHQVLGPAGLVIFG